VTDLSYMFVSATSFNQPINHWDVSTITNMEGMFRGTSFNQPLDNWDVSSVTSMFNMFFGNVAFNQDISNWDVSKVTSMQWMFYNNTGGSSAFNQNLGGWDISSVTTMDGMLWNSGLSRQNYEATLAGWAELDPGETKIPTGVVLSSDGHRYCDDTYRNLLAKSTGEGGYGWTITGDAQDCSLVLSVANQTVDEDTELSFTASATYTGDGTVAYTLDETSEGKGMTLNEETGAFSWTPTQAQTGDHTVTIRARDDGSSEDRYTFTITVNAVNDPPVLAANTSPTISQGGEETITNDMLLVTDEDNTPEEIVFTVTALPANGSLFKNETGLALNDTFTQADIDENKISYRHDGFGSSADKFTFTVSDGSGGTINATDFQVTVDIVLSAEARWNGGVRLYPIPARKEVTVKIVNTYLGTVNLRIVDLSGKEVLMKNVMKENPELIHTINISNVATEISFVRVTMGSQSYALKLMKQ
ncbi:MAG TPA: BspA family leucine-rich repeat surface protein, partial [Cyclobacteriaceae bacterium]